MTGASPTPTSAEKQRGGWGPRRIRAELAAKGVERSVVDETLASLDEAGSPASEEGGAALEQTVRKRFARQFATDPEAAERRLAGFLARRGYDWDTIGRLSRMLRARSLLGGIISQHSLTLYPAQRKLHAV